MKKWMLSLLLCLTVLFSVSAALADHPVGGIKPRLFKPSFRHALRAAGGMGIRTDRTTYEAGQPITFTITLPEGYHYTLAIGVLDGTYEDEDMSDTILERKNLTDPEVIYDMIWTPGEYVVFADFYSAYGYVDYAYAMFTVTPCEGVNQLEQRIQETVSQCMGADDFETMINLHDWILANCSYDYSFEYYSSESLFFLHTGVCNSYSRTFNLLMNAAGIPSRRIAGYAFDDPNSGHAWNAASVDGLWHLYDCTWDDTGSNDQQDPFWSYRWCGLPDELMFDHTAENYIGGSVACTSLDNNYFVRSGAWQEQCGKALAQMTTQLNEGLHRFSIFTDRSFSYTDHPEQESYTNNRIAAAGLSATSWYDIHGDLCHGTFTAVSASPIITGSFDGSGRLTLPAGVTSLEEESLAGTAANYVTVNDGCETIASGAFRDSRVWEITLPDSVMNIAEDIFSVPGVLIIASPDSWAASWAAAHGYPTVSE